MNYFPSSRRTPEPGFVLHAQSMNFTRNSEIHRSHLPNIVRKNSPNKHRKKSLYTSRPLLQTTKKYLTEGFVTPVMYFLWL